MSESNLVYVEGDLFTAPDHSILVHACNTLGSWGSGIALAFRHNYPAQFAQYQAHCETHGQALVGTCLLIPGDKHDIACLFTSRAYGKHKDNPADILAATRKAVKDLEAKNIDNKALHAW
jgi:ADP-ribose 1''-phosphate phosphatase